MKTRAIAAALLIAFSPVAISAPLFAQDDPLTVQARARFKEGVDFYDKGQYENARASFLQAYALKNHPAVLLNLAQSCLRANHSLEAIKYFQQYLRQVQNPTPQQRHDAEAGLEEARGKVGHVDIVAPQGTEVSIVGGDRLGNAPFGEGVDLDPGSYTFKSRATDGSSENIKVTVVAGQRQQIKFGQGSPAVVPPPVASTTPPPPPTNIATPPDPPPAGSDTAAPPPPDTGVTPQKKTDIFSPPKSWIPIAVGGGVTGVGIIGAIVFAVSKGSAQSSADSVDNEIRTTAKARGIATSGLCSTPPGLTGDFSGACKTYRSDIDSVNQDATAANVFIGIAAVGAVFTVGYYLFGPKRGDDSPPKTGLTVQPAPMIDPVTHTNGMSVVGTF